MSRTRVPREPGFSAFAVRANRLANVIAMALRQSDAARDPREFERFSQVGARFGACSCSLQSKEARRCGLVKVSWLVA